MKYVVLGNSLVRHLVIPDVEIISISGMDWEVSVKFLTEQRHRFVNSRVFILIGPLRFTAMHKSRKEVAFKSTNLSTVQQLFAPFFNELKFLNITPIICPLFPMDFAEYNSRICRKGILQSFYEEWNKELRGHIVVENQKIYRFNNNNGLPTPYVHSRLFHRSRGHYRFRPHLLKDGLHVKMIVVDEWRKEFLRVMAKME